MRSACSCKSLFALYGLIGLAAEPASSAIDPAGAAAVFEEARVICEREAGALWGHTLCGPILLVDPLDRAIAANHIDGGKLLQPSGSIFTGILPPTEILANTPVEWSETLWTEMLWPLPEDAAKRHVLIAHELFHRVQAEHNMNRRDGNNKHLDTLEGRYLLQLEWRALSKALNAQDAAAGKAAIADALLFRRERHRLFKDSAAEEAALESNEGVAEYTGVKAGLTTAQAQISFADHDLSAFVGAPTFVRSFSYATGPAYGLLLDQADPAWRDKIGSGRRLDELLGEALRISEFDFSTVKQRAHVYDDGALRAREIQRDQEKSARLAALKAKLVDGAVLILPLSNSRRQFNPQALIPLGESGTVYPTLRLTGDWGVLEVEDVALLDQERKIAVVSSVGIDLPGLKGQGWRLTLNPGWRIQTGNRKGDFAVQRATEEAR